MGLGSGSLGVQGLWVKVWELRSGFWGPTSGYGFLYGFGECMYAFGECTYVPFVRNISQVHPDLDRNPLKP